MSLRREIYDCFAAPWRWLRQEALIQHLLGKFDALAFDLESRMVADRERQADIKTLQDNLERQQIMRISAEALASERRGEVERLHGELSELRAMLQSVMAERLRSLDSLNLKLMEPRAPEVPPDMSQYKAAEKLAVDGMRRIRQIHHQVDSALLAKLHPNFKRNSVPMNAPMVPTHASDDSQIRSSA